MQAEIDESTNMRNHIIGQEFVKQRSFMKYYNSIIKNKTTLHILIVIPVVPKDSKTFEIE